MEKVISNVDGDDDTGKNNTTKIGSISMKSVSIFFSQIFSVFTLQIVGFRFSANFCNRLKMVYFEWCLMIWISLMCDRILRTHKNYINSYIFRKWNQNQINLPIFSLLTDSFRILIKILWFLHVELSESTIISYISQSV